MVSLDQCDKSPFGKSADDDGAESCSQITWQMRRQTNKDARDSTD